ncbi:MULTISPECIES: ribbon-helix-helix domain-containing protein [Acetobacteraceae]|nr:MULTISPECIES: CopG family transcriptional regulator [Acetobacteraceae]MBE7731350.1 CopG family transcriptional regulator [Komagataeibacter sp. FXV3]
MTYGILKVTKMQSAALCGVMRQTVSSKNRITVNLSEDEYAAFDQIAARSKVSKAWLGRHAISLLIERVEGDEQQLPLPLTVSKRRGRQ